MAKRPSTRKQGAARRKAKPAKGLKDDAHGRVKLRLPDGFIGQLVERAFFVDRVGLRVHADSIASLVDPAAETPARGASPFRDLRARWDWVWG